jgi:hypothetical protein
VRHRFGRSADARAIGERLIDERNLIRSALRQRLGFVVFLAVLVPLTPGGLGFVEAGLGHVVTIAGASRPEAHLAIATYRLAATWLPCLAGFVALVLFQRRHRARRLPTPVPSDDRASNESQVTAVVVG